MLLRSTGYRRLFGSAGGAVRLLAALGARLPQGMIGISILLLVSRTTSLTAAGVAVATYSVAFGVTAPLRGRLVDRYGAFRVVGATTAAYVLALVGLAFVCVKTGDAIWASVLSACVGTVAPPLGPTIRAMWSSLDDEQLRRAGVAVDSVFVDISFIVGSAPAAVLTYLTPMGGVLGTTVVTAAGAVCLLGVARSGHFGAGRAGATETSFASGLLKVVAHRAFLRLMAVVVLTNLAVLVVMVGLPWWVRHPGHEQARVFLPRLLWIFGALQLLLAVAPLVGLALAPTLASLALTASDLSRRENATEAQSWVVSFNQLGSSIGALVVTWLVAHQLPMVAMLIAPAACLVAGLVAREGRQSSAAPTPSPR